MYSHILLIFPDSTELKNLGWKNIFLLPVKYSIIFISDISKLLMKHKVFIPFFQLNNLNRWKISLSTPEDRLCLNSKYQYIKSNIIYIRRSNFSTSMFNFIQYLGEHILDCEVLKVIQPHSVHSWSFTWTISY